MKEFDKQNIGFDDGAKIRILQAARELFAEKGYDGASIADIAQKARVNKALPYYYFENKAKILDAIYKQDMQEVKEWRQSFKKEHKVFSKKDFEDFYDKMVDFLYERKDTLNIVLIETMKNNSDYMPLFHFLDPVFKDLKPSLEAMGPRVDDEIRLMTAAFFYDLIPILMFATLGDKWADHNGFSKSDVKSRFIQTLRSIYINYMYETYFGKAKEEKPVNRVPYFLD